LRRVRVYFPRISLRRFLPAVFGENPASADFTDRLLSVFDTVQRSVETKVDNFARYLDPMSASADRNRESFIDFLSWIGSWMGVVLDRSWSECTRRRVLQQAHCLHRLRGTPEGLRRLLLLYLGWDPFPDCRCHCKSSAPTRKTCRARIPTQCACRAFIPTAPPMILEHFKLRRWLFVGGARLGAQSTVWGTRLANRSILDETAQLDVTKTESSGNPRLDPFNLFAHKFSVFVPAGCARTPARKAVLQRLIRSIKPAHTQHQLELVEPRFRIGIQSSIGFDAVVGRYPAGFTLAENRLGRDTLLAEKHPSGPDLEIGVESRIGSSTILD
jgi:phage tail-like protein